MSDEASRYRWREATPYDVIRHAAVRIIAGNARPLRCNWPEKTGSAEGRQEMVFEDGSAVLAYSTVDPVDGGLAMEPEFWIGEPAEEGATDGR